MNKVEEIFNRQNRFFEQGYTRSIAFRQKQLLKLKQLVQKHENEIIEAICKDFGKSAYEVYLTEMMQFYSEVKAMIKNCGKWSRSKQVKIPLECMPGRAVLVREPYGVTLIIGPFNYPFGLLMMPLVGAMAAGNCAIIKPSEHTMNLTKVLQKIINQHFSNSYLHVCDPSSGKRIVADLLELPFQYIFFTGSVATGKLILEKTSKNLIPVTLELGGKSPCIVAQDADIKIAARRIVWGKFMNAGQTCVAPDYLLVHKSIKEELLKALVCEIKSQYDRQQDRNTDYCHIINQASVKRLESYMQDGNVYYGGKVDLEKCYVQPTILVDVKKDSAIMNEEIFGPILPVFEYEKARDIISELTLKEKPLALYIFSENKNRIQYILSHTSSGGVGINETIFHAACSNMPFGGVGNSGMGNYHGKATFMTFTHEKGVFIRGTKLDVPIRYAPYRRKLSFIRKIFHA